ncbi:MAG: hypothetical protein WKH64_11870 [Chloroflexia bacterium]
MGRHPSTERLRTYRFDREPDAALRAHVSNCLRCTQTARRAADDASATQRGLAYLGGGGTQDPHEALARFRVSIDHNRKSERTATVSEFGKRGFRPAYLIVIVAAMLVASLAIAPVRSLAVGLFDVFRVEKFAAIAIDPSMPPFSMDMASAGSAAKRHDPNAMGDYTGPMKPEKPTKVASLQEAAAKTGNQLADAGAAVAGKERSSVFVSEARSASYTVDTAKLQSKLDERGITSIKAPAQLDGKTFTANIPQGVCTVRRRDRVGCVRTGREPTLRIPEGVNMDGMRSDFLMIPGRPRTSRPRYRPLRTGSIPLSCRCLRAAARTSRLTAWTAC